MTIQEIKPTLTPLQVEDTAGAEPDGDGGYQVQLLVQAHKFAALGWPVVLLHGIVNGVCTCSAGATCGKDSGKHPRTEHGLKDATTNPEVIRQWIEAWPDSNIGIVTGAASGISVLDVDPRNGGDISFKALCDEHPDLLNTRAVATGGGGYHLYFRSAGLPTRVNIAGMQGLDFKSTGGYVVAPPSRHKSGKSYSWMNDLETAEVPAFLVEMANASRKKDDSGQPADWLNDIHHGVKDGSRHDSIYKYACRLRRQGLEMNEAELLVLSAASRCSPALPQEDARRALQSAWKHEPPSNVVFDSEALVTASLTAKTLLNTTVEKPPALLGEGLIRRGGLALLIGRPGSRKTWMVLQLSEAMAAGGKIFNLKTFPTTVGLIELELEHDTLQERLRAIANQVGTDSFGRIHVLARPGLQDGIDLLAPGVVDGILSWCGRYKIDLLILDPLSRFHMVDENSSQQMGKVLDEVRRINSAGIAVLLIHHISKGLREKDPLDAIRGSSRLASDPQTVMYLRKTKDLYELSFPKTNLQLTPETVHLSPSESGPFDWVPGSTLKREKNVKKKTDTVGNALKQIASAAGEKGLSVKEMEARTQELGLKTSEPTIRRRLRVMLDSQELEETPGELGKYRLCQECQVSQ